MSDRESRTIAPDWTTVSVAVTVTPTSIDELLKAQQPDCFTWVQTGRSPISVVVRPELEGETVNISRSDQAWSALIPVSADIDRSCEIAASGITSKTLLSGSGNVLLMIFTE